LATAIAQEREHLEALSRLCLAASDSGAAQGHVAGLNQQQRAEFLELADSHHVVVRSLLALGKLLPKGDELSSWIVSGVESERKRIENALLHLQRICRALEDAGCPIVVMKSLDHAPDLGSDLDLYTTAEARAVLEVFHRLGAHVEPRSWGDRLAHKWNFTVPGLHESVEVHCQRLGQTGEHVRLARRLVERRTPLKLGDSTFSVPAPEERILVAVLQRMYRHFYFRLCDIVNTAGLLESGTVDFGELRHAATLAGIWPGVATYLKIVSDYVRKYRGRGIDLPARVIADARFGGDKLFASRRFLRIPVMPEGAGLFTQQVARTALRGDMPATFRLSLLPPLAATAAMAFRMTGDDKGIW
jgi:hypothetical protein